MGKYKYLNADEIITRVENLGSEDEREIVDKLSHDWENCPECDRNKVLFAAAWARIESALGDLDQATTNLDKAQEKLQ